MTDDLVERQTLATNISRALIKKWWTPAELARQSGLTRDRLSSFVRREATPTAEELQALAKALDVEAAALLAPVDPSPPDPIGDLLAKERLAELNRLQDDFEAGKITNAQMVEAMDAWEKTRRN